MILFFMLGCTLDGVDDLRRELLQSWGEDVVVAHGRLIEEKVQLLYTQHQIFCENTPSFR